MPILRLDDVPRLPARDRRELARLMLTLPLADPVLDWWRDALNREALHVLLRDSGAGL